MSSIVEKKQAKKEQKNDHLCSFWAHYYIFKILDGYILFRYFYLTKCENLNIIGVICCEEKNLFLKFYFFFYNFQLIKFTPL